MELEKAKEEEKQLLAELQVAREHLVAEKERLAADAIRELKVREGFGVTLTPT
jgi:hypothetical protein